VWLHHDDTYAGASGTLTQPGAMNDVVLWGEGVDTSTEWCLHVCVEKDVAPYPFYFWFTRQKPVNYNSITSTSTGFFCMDALADIHPLDNEQVIFYHYNNLNLDMDGSLFSNSKLHTWYKKPDTFGSRSVFEQSINNNSSRFLGTSAARLCVQYDYGSFPNAPAREDPWYYQCVPNGDNMRMDLRSNALSLFPVMYFKDTTKPRRRPPVENNYYDDSFSFPSAYKGMSSFVKFSLIKLNQFDQLQNKVSEDSNYIAVGLNPQIMVPWNDSNILI
jgi:hypothetical protein